MTLKVHVIAHHYKYYFETARITFKDTNGEFTEACQSSLRISEETHGLKVVRKLGTPVHQQRSFQSLTFYNSKSEGYSTPFRLRKRSLSSPHSLFYPSQRTPFTNHFKNRYPVPVEEHNLTKNKTFG